MSTKPGRSATTLDSTVSENRWPTAAPWSNFYFVQRLAGRVVGYSILILLTLSSIFPLVWMVSTVQPARRPVRRIQAESSIFPLVWMVSTSLRERYDVFGGPIIPKHVNLDAYRFILTDFHIITYFRNSLVITSTTVLAVVSLATLAGYAFAHLDFWGKEIIFLVLLGTMMVPPTVLILPLFLQLRDLGLVDTQRGLALAYISSGIAFSVFLMRSFFKTLPTELIDAGRVDGASELGIFLRIMLPLARPGIATVLIFQFMGTWNEFLYAATIVQTPKMRNLQPAIFSMVGRYSTNWPALTAALTLSILPIIIVYIFMQRQFVAGLTAGAVRG